MKRFLFYTFAMLISFLLQASAVRLFDTDMSGVTPNFLLILIVAFAVMRGDRTGLLLGFFSGLLIDLVFGNFVGYHAAMLMFLGFFVGLLCMSLPKDSLLVYIPIVAVTDLVFEFLNYVFMFLLRARFDLGFYMREVIVPEVILTTVISLFIIPFYIFVDDNFSYDELRRAKKFV